MQEFLNNERVEQNKKGVLERIKNYEEIYERFDSKSAKAQASRCVQCGIPYCHGGCPLYNFIPQWLKFVAGDDLKLAFKISNESSPFPEIMGRICPHDRLCEGACTLNASFGAITIGSIESYITETGFDMGLSPEFPGVVTGRKAAVIGAGPAGLSVATFLLRAGIEAHIYEKESFAGGLLTWGIPDFKLNKQTVFNRVKMLENAGAKLYLGKEVGKNVSFDELLGGYDALFLGLGAKKANKAEIKGEESEGVYEAMEFLGSVQLRRLGQANIKPIDIKNKTVAVIGGGDTAMDCVRTAIREGAKEVYCIYRRDEQSMPGSRKEYKNAVEEGANFIFNSVVKKINAKDGKVQSIKKVATELKKESASDRGTIVEMAGSEKSMSVDVVVTALGFSVKLPEFVATSGVQLDKYGQVVVDKERKTSLDKVYAGGDCVRGANLVVNAALDGREAAKAIVKKLIGG